jgi:hypothetical protein
MFVMGQLGANFGVNCRNWRLEMQFWASGGGRIGPRNGVVRPYLIRRAAGLRGLVAGV